MHIRRIVLFAVISWILWTGSGCHRASTSASEHEDGDRPPVPVSDAVVIPERAIAEQDGAIVTTMIEGGKTKTAQLKLGARAAGMVQVLEGLHDGDEVAIEGGYGLPPGTPVVANLKEE